MEAGGGARAPWGGADWGVTFPRWFVTSRRRWGPPGDDLARRQRWHLTARAEGR